MENSAKQKVEVKTRGYQQEMLDESLQRNIIIALETGSGKTHIAVLRMKREIELEPKKVCWFLTPTVTLCKQQHKVINQALPVPVGQISGDLQPDQWKDRKLWRTALRDHRILVSTPQVLLDALRHGYVDLVANISLVVFDEAHHAVDNHPYNRVMLEFYRPLPTDGSVSRPRILGLTASPIYGGGDIRKAFNTIEGNLDCAIRTSILNQQELASFVHRPIFEQIKYRPQQGRYSANLLALDYIVRQIKIDDDPYVKSLRSQLSDSTLDPAKRKRLDQKLSKTIHKEDTYTHKGLRDFLAAAQQICDDLGPWPADWYIDQVIRKALRSNKPFNNIISNVVNNERDYLTNILRRIQPQPVSSNPEDIANGCSQKLDTLIACLRDEKVECEDRNDAYSGLIFVQRRDTVVVLSEVLNVHPFSSGLFKVGSLVGSSDNAWRKSFLDITRKLMKLTEDETLDGFRIGEINVVVATSVAEEGIDIQACCHVTRWDPPPNMASWIQSRGRARRQHSTFTLLFAEGVVSDNDLMTWQRREDEMVQMYNKTRSDVMQILDKNDLEGDDDDDENLEFRIESTGACLTLQSAVPHLSHFCAVMPTSSFARYEPLYDIDPPDFPQNWHSLENRNASPNVGPFGCKVTLPRLLPQELREFTTPTEHKSKRSAYRHVAFIAYRKLYDAGLLNDHLLPFTSVLEPSLEPVVKELLKDVEKKASTANVSIQMNPWMPADIDESWWLSELEFEGSVSQRMLTKTKPPTWTWDDPIIIHRPHHSETRVTLRALSKHTPLDNNDELLTLARHYTRRLFWILYGNRMNWEEMGFCYLFLPPTCDEDAPPWLESFDLDCESLHAAELYQNAREFGGQFEYPDDITLVGTVQKVWRFQDWRFDPLSCEEEEIMRAMNRFEEDDEIEYPLLEVERLPQRTNFLLPIPKASNCHLSAQSPPNRHVQRYIQPSSVRVVLASEAQVTMSTVLPSILRAMAMSSTVYSLRTTLFRGPYECLRSIPNHLLLTAITAPVAQEQQNYQRLETLGDAVLKLMASLQLLAEYPLWHEGYLSRKKDHAVSNARLAKEASRLELYKWIIRDRYKGKKWQPDMLTTAHIEDFKSQEFSNIDVDGAKRNKSAKKPKEQLSMKVLADVIESILGASYLAGGFELSLQCVKLFDLGLIWRTMADRVEQMLERATKLAPGQVLPPQLEYVEKMLGYKFSNKLVLQEALTHGSHHPHHQAADTISYERMEFLGDCVLDMIVTEYLYHAKPIHGKPYSPGHMFLRKAALVNAHFLAFICLRQSCEVTVEMPQPQGRDPRNPQLSLVQQTQHIHLYQCLLHSSQHILSAQQEVWIRYQRVHDKIAEVLFDSDSEGHEKKSSLFPWADLTRLQAPKLFSDIIESLIGAVYLDSHGNLDVVQKVLTKLGWMQVMKKIVEKGVDVQHPVSRLHLWASKVGKDVKWVLDEPKKGNIIKCSILVDGEEKVSEEQVGNSHSSKGEVKLRAAERFNWEYTLNDLDLTQSSVTMKKLDRRTRSQGNKSKLKGTGPALKK